MSQENLLVPIGGGIDDDGGGGGGIDDTASRVADSMRYLELSDAISIGHDELAAGGNNGIPTAASDESDA